MFGYGKSLLLTTFGFINVNAFAFSALQTPLFLSHWLDVYTTAGYDNFICPSLKQQLRPSSTLPLTAAICYRRVPDANTGDTKQHLSPR